MGLRDRCTEFTTPAVKPQRHERIGIKFIQRPSNVHPPARNDEPPVINFPDVYG